MSEWGARVRIKESQVWTAAESCEQLEKIAGELMAESVNCRETEKRRQELESVKRRAAFKLITPKSAHRGGMPAIPIGYEEVFLAALEQHQKEQSDLYPA